MPIVPAAVLFDPGRFGRAFNDRPTEEFGRRAAEAASAGPVAMGNVGAGAGAVAGGLKGGLGTASVDLGNGVIVGAIVAVNAGGSTVNPATGEFYAKYLELNGEFGPLKVPFAQGAGTGEQLALAASEPVKNTTIAVVATNVKLTKAQAKKIAEMAQDGLARAIRPAHTMFDGDTVFALGTGLLDLDTLKQQAAWGFTPRTSMPWAPLQPMPWPAPSCGRCSTQRLLAPHRLIGTVSPALLATDAPGPKQHSI